MEPRDGLPRRTYQPSESFPLAQDEIQKPQCAPGIWIVKENEKSQTPLKPPNLGKVVEASVDEGEAKTSAASLHFHCQLLHPLGWVGWVGWDALVPKNGSRKYDLATSWAGRRLLGCYDQRTCMTPMVAAGD